jgi:hypothetical protein
MSKQGSAERRLAQTFSGLRAEGAIDAKIAPIYRGASHVRPIRTGFIQVSLNKSWALLEGA